MTHPKLSFLSSTSVRVLLFLTVFSSSGIVAHAQSSDAIDDEVVVTGQLRTFSEVSTTTEMLEQESPITSVLATIDNLPGVSVGEGDSYGFDDWSTSIFIRGFQTSLAEQQIGMTIDGLPNGNSNYGGGAKPNRYIDTMNLAGVSVSQGTADVGSLSNEALGGTLNFLTQDPMEETRFRLSGSIGDHKGQRLYGRYDTGLFLNDTTRAWVSMSRQTATDFLEGSAENERDHTAFKIVSEVDDLKLTAYASFDDTHEDNYQRIYSAAQYEAFPDTDGLLGEWIGTPNRDQAYRQAWSTLRSNTFGYVRAETTLMDTIDIDGSLYFHSNAGRGDWVPPYLAQVTADGAGNPESELNPNQTVFGGSPLGVFLFVDANGVALAPDPNCTPSGNLGAYGPLSAANDPTCYPAGAIAVQSYRHTHYNKKRRGFSGNSAWNFEGDKFDNTLRGGIWYEDYVRDESRDWHKITDTRVGPTFNNQPYWIQYDRSYPVKTFKWYIEDTVEYGPVAISLGIKQFMVDLERGDQFDNSQNISLNSDSDVLFSGGIVYQLPIEGLEFFGGYAENFAAIKDGILERPASDLNNIVPETAENIDLGLRYDNGRLKGSLTYYDIDFQNRIIFIAPGTSSGPDYLIGTNGTYFNAGGVISKGIEAAGSFDLMDTISLYSSFTYNDSEYVGTGDAVVDAAAGLIPGNTVAGAADTMFVLSGNWASGPYAVGISGKYTGSRFADIANTWEIDSNTILNLNASVSGDVISDSLAGFKLSLVINNLLDEKYLGTVSSNAAWLGAPRTAVMTLTADF